MGFSVAIIVANVILVVFIVAHWLLTYHSGNVSPLTRERIIRALTRLGELAQEQGHTLMLVVVGGAALVLRYNARGSTQDVDVFMLTPPERRDTRAWAEIVARELGLRHEWLNDGAKGFMQGVSYGPLLLEAPGIQVYQVGSEQLLAMKLSAWRGELDQQDAVIVMRDLAQTYTSKEALWIAIAPYVTNFKAQYAFEECWEDLYG